MKPPALLCPWKAVVPLLMSLVCLTQSSEYEYLTWKRELFPTGPEVYVKPPQCLEIPDDLRLCHGVGYNQMRLPNLLEHETMAEVKQQAGSWVPLVHKNCHPSTQVFLCSLFTPVCLDQPIYPCRWLCEDVRDACTPIMQAFGFPWPEMLTCNKFPEGDVCLSAPNASESALPNGVSPICPPCDHEVDAILDHICASEFAWLSTARCVVLRLCNPALICFCISHSSIVCAHHIFIFINEYILFELKFTLILCTVVLFCYLFVVCCLFVLSGSTRVGWVPLTESWFLPRFLPLKGSVFLPLCHHKIGISVVLL
uniref:Secreted frizzled related protein 1 n=1 Tax=Astyanax mexicanus TaxID=7994 RepID=A0A8B9JWZ2_ASTMX